MEAVLGISREAALEWGLAALGALGVIYATLAVIALFTPLPFERYELPEDCE
jgi:hypothetical protein